MKKILSVFLIIVMITACCCGMTACGNKNTGNYEVVLITDGAPINDHGINQSAWNGVKAYAEKNKLNCRYYQPDLSNEETVNQTIASYIEIAAQSGAKQIVLPGEIFASSAYEIAPTYQEVEFLLIEALPHSQDDPTPRFISNVESISFDKLQAGFLAGYTSVISGLKYSNGDVKRDYNTKLGYLGSVNSQDSADYGAGFIQGAGYAADEATLPVYMDYAEYDNPSLAYDYSFTIEPVYISREDADKETFKVTVVDGIGSGVYTDGENVTITANPAPAGKIFDHWEVKSDTKGVKDRKVNISSKKDASMNLLVGDCDCTITAVWADADTVQLSVITPQYDIPYEQQLSMSKVNAVDYYAPKNSEYWVEAPAAPSGYVFDRWTSADESVIKDIYSKGTMVTVGEQDLQLIPEYKLSETPTFDITVKSGTGSGSYVAGDEVKIVADAPQDGYMFYKWENVDNQGLSTGIAMENEYCYHTTFHMVDRFASVAEMMFDDGAQVVFSGGTDISDSVFSAAGEFDDDVFAFGYGIDEGGKGKCLASVVNDYGHAVELAFADFKGGSIFSANCGNQCLYVTGFSTEEYLTEADGSFKKDKKGNELKDENFNEGYAKVYTGLSDGSIKTKHIEKGADMNAINTAACLTLNVWIK